MKLKDMRIRLDDIEKKINSLEKEIRRQDINDEDFFLNLKKHANLLNEYSEFKNVLIIAQINTVVQEHPHITLNQVYLEKEQIEKLRNLYSYLVTHNIFYKKEQPCSDRDFDNNLELIKKQSKKIEARYRDINELFDNIALNTSVFTEDTSKEEKEREKVSEFVQYLEELLINEEKMSLSDIPKLISSFSEEKEGQELIIENKDVKQDEEKLLDELKKLKNTMEEKEYQKKKEEKEKKEDISTWEEITALQRIYVETGSLSKVVEFCELRKCPFSLREIEVYINKKFHSDEENSFYDPVEHMHTHNKE